MPLTRFEEYWPLPKESLAELNIVTLALWPISSGVLTPLLLPYLSLSLTDFLAFLESITPLKNWCSIHARWSKSSLKHSILFCGIFPSLKRIFVAYRSSKVSSRPDCIFEIHQLWQSGFRRVYSNCCCICWFEPEIIKICQLSHKMYSNKILNYQESTTISKVWKLIEGTTYKLQLDRN